VCTIGLLPGLGVALMEQNQMQLCDTCPGADGHAAECSLSPKLYATVVANDLRLGKTTFFTTVPLAELVGLLVKFAVSARPGH
jgi:hypothetical protein